MAVVATGFFDGVHCGHRKVIETVVSLARERAEESIIITFGRHPRTILQQDARSLRLLNSAEEKIYRLKSLGVDRVEVLNFSRDFAQLSAREYISDILLNRFSTTCLVMGYDNRLGSDKLTPEAVRPIAESLGIELLVPEIVPVSIGDHSDVTNGPTITEGCLSAAANPSRHCERSVAISSTVIRNALSEGRVEDAAAMLGYDYSLKGVVVSGKQLGRKLGYPTANMQMFDPLKLIPGRGVYFTKVRTLSREYYGMTNVGDIVETHIFDFDENIYGLDIELEFIQKLRNGKQFNSLDDLKSQLAADKLACDKLLNHYQ